MDLTDFNGDGQPDLLVAFPWVLFPGKAGGRFGSPQALPSGILIPSFAPVKKGGLPAIFDTGDPLALRIFVNTSKK
jgi:FG-GAP repeat protein